MHLRTRILIATSALVLSACGDGGVLEEEDVSSTSAALVVDYDGTWTMVWNANPGPNQGGYAHLTQRFNGGAWTTIYYTGLGQQSYTVTATQYGVYDYKVNYWYMPQDPCGQRYCIPGLVQRSINLQSVQYVATGGQGGSAGNGGSGTGGTAGSGGSATGGVAGSGGSGTGGVAGGSGSAGQGGMSGGTTGTAGTSGTGGTPCTGDADCSPTHLCANGTCVMRGCGNGVLEPGEGCDDGNGTSGDGCENCTVTD